MKVTLIFSVILNFFLIEALSAQSEKKYFIQGNIVDTITNRPITEALVTFTGKGFVETFITDKTGYFKALSTSNNITITISQYGFHTKHLQLGLIDDSTNLGTIYMQNLSFRLGEITIKGHPPGVRVNKDTIEFKSSSFEVVENALLGELLKSLPGLELSADGNITYHGEAIEKILIDGQEYFGSQIPLALKNISADMIDKMQIISTDNLALGNISSSGIEKTKVLNLTIKDTHKEKVSGNTQLGYGINSSYFASLALNRFGNKKQLSLYSNADNINGMSDGKLRTTNGINKTVEAGINYNHSINLKNTFLVNLQYSSLSYFNTNSTRREYINTTPSGINFQLSNTNFSTKDISGEIKYVLKPNTASQFTQRIQMKSAYRKSISSSQYSNNFPNLGLNVNGNAVNTSTTPNNSISYNGDFQKRLQKGNGFFSQSVNLNYHNERNNIDYISTYTQKSGDSTIINKLNNFNPINNNSINASGITVLNYSISRSLEFNGFYSILYNHTVNWNEVLKRDPLNLERLTIVDSLNSNWKYSNKQNFLSIGLTSQTSKFEGKISINGIIINQNLKPINRNMVDLGWNYIFPRINLSYFFLRTTSLSYILNYDPIVIAPSLLISTPNFQNPLIVQSGNPNLKNPVRRSMTLRFSHLNTKSLTNFNTMLTYATTNKKIVNNTIFDSLGRQVITPINMEHSTMASWGTTYSKPFFKRRLAINLSNNVLYANDPVSVSGILGTSESLSITPRVSINYTKKELIDIQSSFSANRTYSTYNLGTVTKNEVTSFNMNLDVTGYLPLGFIAGVKYNKVVTSGLSAGFNRSVDLLNVFLSKRLLKNKMEIKAQGFDILNNNNSFSRTFTPTYFEDTQSTVLQRFFMGSIVYYIK